MIIYLDVCCLKRPFDDHAQPRVRVEAEAVLGLLEQDGERATLIRSVAHRLENDQNRWPGVRDESAHGSERDPSLRLPPTSFGPALESS